MLLLRIHTWMRILPRSCASRTGIRQVHRYILAIIILWRRNYFEEATGRRLFKNVVGSTKFSVSLVVAEVYLLSCFVFFLD